MRVHRFAAVAATSIAVSLGAVGCSDDSGTTNTTDRPIRIGIGEPKHLIPSNTTESSGAQVLAALFTPLVEFDADKKPYPVAAESIESPDNVVWTIKLKDGYTFHDGEKVTADHYINAWNYGAYGPNAQDGAYFFERIQGFDQLQATDPDGPDGPQPPAEPTARKLSGLVKVDDLTFTVTLSAPFADFRSLVGYNVFHPLPSAAWAADGVLAEGFEEKLIGNGPFKMKGSWEHDSRIEVERYDAHPGPKPKVSGVEFRIYQQPAAEYADLTSGNNDVMRQIPTEHLVQATQDLGERFQQSPSSIFQFLAFPTYQEEFAKPEVRRAISMAIDRDEISTAVFKNSQSPARSFVSPVVAGARPDTCGEYCRFDPARAKELYHANGGPDRIQISYNGDGGHKDWVDATCNQLQTNLGIKCVGVAEPKFSDLLTKVSQRKPVGLFRMGWSMDYPSMENYLGPLYSSTGSSNYYGYRNAEFDALLREGSQAASQDEAIAKYQAAEDILARDLPVIPLRFAQNSFGHSDQVRNVRLDLFGQVDLFAIELVG
jgi:oligopeptide transport system substrate-binding protein